jgi:hypothetical protein
VALGVTLQQQPYPSASQAGPSPLNQQAALGGQATTLSELSEAPLAKALIVRQGCLICGMFVTSYVTRDRELYKRAALPRE